MSTKIKEEKAKRDRGMGRIFQPGWKDPKTGERKKSPVWWIAPDGHLDSPTCGHQEFPHPLGKLQGDEKGKIL
jgi:hypothetical protein